MSPLSPPFWRQMRVERKDAAATKAPVEDADFLPAAVIDGVKPGYEFRAGDQGQGYYKEVEFLAFGSFGSTSYGTPKPGYEFRRNGRLANKGKGYYKIAAGGATAAGAIDVEEEVAMTRFTNSQKMDAKLEEWQLLFGSRESEKASDLGDDDPAAAAVAELLRTCDDKTLTQGDGGSAGPVKRGRSGEAKGPKEPKRPRSAYACFQAAGTLGGGDAGRKWKTMTSEQKQPFEAKAVEVRSLLP